ncbi:hypothetical protein EC988_007336, partial [Linderina pennispora]
VDRLLAVPAHRRVPTSVLILPARTRHTLSATTAPGSSRHAALELPASSLVRQLSATGPRP